MEKLITKRLAIQGVIPPLITPLETDNSLDRVGLHRLLEYQIGGGIHGLFILGTTGEGTSLSLELKKELISEVCAYVNHRIPVLVSITDPSMISAIRLAEYAAKCGADAVVFAAPYYFLLGREEFEKYLRQLVKNLPIPFMLYNMPVHTKLKISPETVLLARDLGAIGIKDSSGDIDNLMTLIDLFKSDPDFYVISGSEIFLPETILAGGDGVIAGGANIFPHLYVRLYDAAVQKDMEMIQFLRQALMQIEITIYSVGTTYSKTISAIKCSLSVMDVCNDHHAPPLLELDAEQRNNIKIHLDKIRKDYSAILPQAKTAGLSR
ncbi:MAG: dihydrodipicolinate synthase family protein, partial [Saprospiraceae bacterium]|nr:dihydrodipicolinate synthase family protein [Saprospiraceae bacterium]